MEATSEILEGKGIDYIGNVSDEWRAKLAYSVDRRLSCRGATTAGSAVPTLPVFYVASMQSSSDNSRGA
jgi:hypothetical protein